MPECQTVQYRNKWTPVQYRKATLPDRCWMSKYRCIYLFRQNPVLTTLHLRSAVNGSRLCKDHCLCINQPPLTMWWQNMYPLSLFLSSVDRMWPDPVQTHAQAEKEESCLFSQLITNKWIISWDYPLNFEGGGVWGGSADYGVRSAGEIIFCRRQRFSLFSGGGRRKTGNSIYLSCVEWYIRGKN